MPPNRLSTRPACNRRLFRGALLAAGLLLTFSTPAAIPAAAAGRTAGHTPEPAGVGQSPWPRVPPVSDLPNDRPLRAGFLIVDGVYNSELMAPYDIFQHTIFHTEPGIEVFTVSPDGAPITTFEGLIITPHHGFADAPEIDILVVPSAEGSMTTDLENREMMDWVRSVGATASYLISLCDGAFVFAAAGLLDDRAVTTFPGDQDRFAATFPELDLHRGVSFVHDGPVLTSEGGAKSYDVAMYLVDHLYGVDVARGVGGGLIIDWPPAPDRMPALVVTH